MSKLDEIEAAADALSSEEKQQLLLFLASRIREHADHMPEPRLFSHAQMGSWIAEDEADMRRFDQGG